MEWPFIDGRHLSQGVDLWAVVHRASARRVFNLIDTIIIDEQILDARDDGARSTAKTNLTSGYDRMRAEGGSNDEDGSYASEMQPHGYLVPDEFGYPGLEPPMG